MAGTERRVEYLAGFHCPVGALAAGKSRVLRHKAEIFLCTGREFVYVYDQGGRRLRVVYQFPDQVWHLEFLALCRMLYVLCAGKGIYCLSLDPPGRLAHQAEPEAEDSVLPAHVVPVDPGTRVLPDATLCAFTVLDDVLVTLAQGPARWKMQLFERPRAGADPQPGAQIGGPELLALSAKGRLMTCSLDQSSEAPCPAPMTAAKAGQKIKELLCGIGHVSERVSSLKKAVDQRNRALTCLNEAMNVSCALLSSRAAPRPISCTTATTWSHLPPRDVLLATCLLENGSAHTLGRGWTLCIQVRSSTCALELGSASPAATYTVPVEQLGPGSRREVTLSLGPGEDGALDLPITVSCALFCSLREVIGAACAPSDTPEHPFFEEWPPDILPERDGVCLPLGEHTVDLLQCLRFPGLAAPGAPAPSMQGPASDPVDTFLGSLREAGSEPAGPASLRAKYLPPSVASIRVSSELLRAALDTGRSGVPLCCATLQWLLGEHPAADSVRAQALSSVQGVAPDGGDVRLSVHEVAVTDLCPEGPVQAVEIQVESASLADLCRAHHALISRMQAMVVAQAAQGSSPPELRVQHLRQMHAQHEALLREVQALRDGLCGEDEAQACATAEKLLQVYRRLRHPGLLLL